MATKTIAVAARSGDLAAVFSATQPQRLTTVAAQSAKPTAVATTIVLRPATRAAAAACVHQQGVQANHEQRQQCPHALPHTA